ncbi:MAG: MBL fold metallo-hydrolase, partial [Pseudomonadota bacterium]
MPLEIVTIPCLSDNYAFLIRDETTGTVACVDAPEAGPIIAEAEARGWSIDTLLITHHHPDHIDGIPGLVARFGSKVVGAAADAHRIPGLDVKVAEGDSIAVGAESAEILDVSGHTVGHIAFHFA